MEKARRNSRRPAIILLATVALGSCSSLTDPEGLGIRGRTVITGGLLRYYEWTARVGESPKPVLLAFHGLGGNPTEFRQNSELVSAGREAGYVVVFPQAANEANRGWAVGCAGCTDADELGIDDVAFVDAVLDDLEQRTPIDRSRVYATGFSMGGWFTYTLACQRAGMVKAIAPLGGLMPRPVAAQCAPTHPVGALVIFGDLDQTQPIDGRPGPFGLLGADSSATFWSTAAHCLTTSPDEQRAFGSTQVRIVERSNCDGGVTVERHRVIGLTHAWPKGNYDATREILRFFASH
jgi:polyhydroxybutyrate depolymerase